MSGPYQGRDLSNCGVGRLRVAINCGVLSVNAIHFLYRKLFISLTSLPQSDRVHYNLLVNQFLCKASLYVHRYIPFSILFMYSIVALLRNFLTVKRGRR